MIYLCPPINSLLFSKGLPKAKVIKAYGAGHYISDPGVKDLMKQEIDESTEFIKKKLFY